MRDWFNNISIVGHPIIGPKHNCFIDIHYLSWLNSMPSSTFFCIYPVDDVPDDLEPGYDYYVIYLNEPLDISWLTRQSANLDGKIFVLHNGQCYNNIFGSNVYFYRFYNLHYHLETMHKMHGIPSQKNYFYKASAINNRVTYTKLITTTSLLEYLDDEDCLIKINSDWIEDKNVNWRQDVGVNSLDNLAKIFYKKYTNGGYDPEEDAVFKVSNDTFNNCNYNTRFLQEAALHFSLETYAWSWMMDESGYHYTRPGPELTEKTLKCLAGSAAFVPVGQAHIYKFLEEVGFQFDYGPLDLSFDNEVKNFDRLLKTIDLIKSLRNYSIDDIVNFTKSSTEHNYNHIVSGNLAKICNQINQNTVNNVLNSL